MPTKGHGRQPPVLQRGAEAGIVQGRRLPSVAIARGLAALVLGGWIALSAFQPFEPALPQDGLDASWVAAVGEAADRGLRWGVDLAFTYGPAASLVTGYFNADYFPITLPLLLVMCLLLGACAVLLLGSGGRVPVVPARLAAIAVSLGLVAAFSNGNSDGLFIVLPLLPFLLVLSREQPSRTALGVAAATALVVGMIGMGKMSFPLAALPLFILGDVTAMMRRRPPVLTLCCVLGLLAADLLYGQSLADLPVFVHQQWEVVAGYSEAMAMDGSRRELALYGGLAALLVVLAAAADRAASRRRSLLDLVVPAGLAWVLLLVFKAGFVRQDAHTLIAWSGLALATCIIGWARMAPAWPRLGAATVLAAVAGSALVGLSIVGPTAQPGHRLDGAAATARRLLVDQPAGQVAAAIGLARDPAAVTAAWRAAKAQRWHDLAEAAPLARLEGGVDIIPSVQSRVIASGLDYRPRPSFQEYSTYTPGLVAANRAFLAGPKAPAWILFGPESGLGSMSIDNRYPNLTEGALWLDLLERYRPERRTGGLLALHRRAVPAPLDLGAPRRLEVGFGETVTVDPAQRATFATIEVRPSLLGRLAGFLYKPAPLTLAVSFADGGERRYRFLSGLGASGFVLSPVVDNATEFELLSDGAAPPPDRVVTGFRVEVPAKLAALVSPRINVELRSLSGGDGTAPPVPASAWASLAEAYGLAPDARTLQAPAPSVVNVPVAGLARVELGFGLALAADAPNPERICFAVHPADGTARDLWRHCLDGGRADDRAAQTLSVTVPPGTAELALETSCQAGCDEGLQAYWAPP